MKKLCSLLYLVALLCGFALSIIHRSATPFIVGRYSLAYAIYLTLYSALIIMTIVLVVTQRANTLRLLVGYIKSAHAVGFYSTLFVLAFIILQVLDENRLWVDIWFLFIMLIFLLTIASFLTKPVLLKVLTQLERVTSSRMFIRLIIFCISSIVCLFSLECVLRIWQPTLVGTSWYISDPEIGFRLRGGEQGMNSGGFRDREHPLKKPDGAYRILALGDSFAWAAFQYQDAYLTLLERKLNEQLRIRIEIVNMGIPAYGPKEELRLLEKRGLQYAPDHVVVNFYMGNDLLDNMPGYKERIWLNGMIFKVRTFPWGILKVRYWFAGHYFRIGRMAFWGRLREQNRKKNMRQEDTGSTGCKRAEEITHAGSPPALTEEEWMVAVQGVIRNYLRSNEGNTRDLVNNVAHILLQMKTISERNGARFSIILLPDIVQVDLNIQERAIALLGMRKSDFNFERPNELLAEFSRDNNIPCIDLLPYFKEGCNKDKLYLSRDCHWNEEGNRLSAEAICDIIRRDNPIR